LADLELSATDEHQFGHPELAVLHSPGKANPTGAPGA
jgi:hypothetical protein